MSVSHSNNASGRKRQRWNPCFDYKVDYNDHFETPLVAYQDILPLLDGVNRSKRKDHVIYDPYYCNGKAAVLLKQLGFTKVVHAKRDFYKDIKEKTVPPYDTLVTNPPYSDDHKIKCLEFCLEQLQQSSRPFFLLMPNYVAARNYYRLQLLQANALDDVAYLLPSAPYQYNHPEGTGHEVSPFASLWFLGVGKENMGRLKDCWDKRKSNNGGPRFIPSFKELAELEAIPTQRRPNPRQRKKRRVTSQDGKSRDNKTAQAQPNKNSTTKSKSKKSSSRYRDETGKRTRKRF